MVRMAAGCGRCLGIAHHRNKSSPQRLKPPSLAAVCRPEGLLHPKSKAWPLDCARDSFLIDAKRKVLRCAQDDNGKECSGGEENARARTAVPHKSKSKAWPLDFARGDS